VKKSFTARRARRELAFSAIERRIRSKTDKACRLGLAVDIARASR
jgi:hypothetical protein